MLNVVVNSQLTMAVNAEIWLVAVKSEYFGLTVDLTSTTEFSVTLLNISLLDWSDSDSEYINDCLLLLFLLLKLN